MRNRKQLFVFTLRKELSCFINKHDENYGIKKDSKIESFHLSRRMFVIINNELILAEPNVPYSHAEWFEKEGWISNEKDSNSINNNVRGFVDTVGIYGYIGYDFRCTPLVENTLKTSAILEQFVSKLSLDKGTFIYAGMTKNQTGVKYSPVVCLGKIIDYTKGD